MHYPLFVRVAVQTIQTENIANHPIRGFRTGFSKVSQLLSKELFYQLPDTEDSRKLVVFSDSREDAASISNGIEKSSLR